MYWQQPPERYLLLPWTVSQNKLNMNPSPSSSDRAAGWTNLKFPAQPHCKPYSNREADKCMGREEKGARASELKPVHSARGMPEVYQLCQGAATSTKHPSGEDDCHHKDAGGHDKCHQKPGTQDMVPLLTDMQAWAERADVRNPHAAPCPSQWAKCAQQAKMEKSSVCICYSGTAESVALAPA